MCRCWSTEHIGLQDTLVYRRHWSREHRDSSPIISAPSIDAGLQNTLVYRIHWSTEHRESRLNTLAERIHAGLQNTGLQNMVYRTQRQQLCRLLACAESWWQRSGWILVVYRTWSTVYRSLVYRAWSTEHRDGSPVTYWRVLTAGDEGLVGSWRQPSITCLHCSTQNNMDSLAWITHSIFGNVPT